PFLVYTPLADDNSDYSYPSFTFRVQDDDGTANGGADTDPSSRTITFNIAPVDDPPVPDINTGMATFEGFTTTLTTAMLSAHDVDTPDSAIVYTITGPVSHGRIELTIAPGVAVASFTQDDLANNRVVYVHDSSENFTDSFDFTLGDAT